ncbi:N-alpha-acetyltransferase 35, NatC auxiliary subunit isoform X2 [Parasteatoda tepidariorum]|uniref:N-alpha-acetyltransferase 35, NatC auxiliary subunit isoform X1 n=1 Tax=Parasteatoda tepidariorum TaxID=114398 RepID=UPI00077FA450|nr:N-alpha-acetyltransferase 35, NatC auxiliary subunit isoform X1 [Parasteatoda tepidariorum]XP_042909669.1 N-alpha-acetyltransferase 35, NatC auxiliary subunit isoform X2 [Parasteatoda tepidariorum]
MSDDTVSPSSKNGLEDKKVETMDAGATVSSNSYQKCCSYNWINVTEEFFKATEELELGELLHDDMFGLFEAMSAIEMMDPKMDAGMMCNRGSKKVLNFDQALKAGKLKIKDLSAEEQIGIIDATLACLVTWLEGHSLAQTVFTNLYLQKPHLVEDKIIRAFSIHLLKMLEVIRDFVNKAGVFEEEDFQPVMYGYKLANEIPIGKATTMMKEVEDELQKKVKITRSKPGEEQPTEVQIQHEDAVALCSRIKFCRLFYQALMTFQKKKCQAVEECDRFLIQCLELIPVIEKTIHLGISPDPKAESSNRADYPTILGFEPLVNQRLLPPTFPRYTKIKTRKESMNYLLYLVTRLRTICNITECITFHSALDFMNEFSKTSPCVLSRSVLQLLYLNHSKCSVPGKVLGTMHIVDVLRDAIRSFIKPPILMPRSPLMMNLQTKEYVESFLGHCVRPFCTLIQITGHNRARQRDKLSHLIEELAALQEEADKVDAYLHNVSTNLDNHFPHLACFGTWVLYHILKIMIQYVLSGFELELYSSHEYTYIFWYLYEFLYGWMVSALSRANSYLSEQECKAEQMSQKGRNSKRNKKKKRIQPHKREIILTQALQNLCGGYYKAVCGFSLDGKLKRPCVEFDNERVRYEHRFAPFNSIITPPPVPYSQFKDVAEMLQFHSTPTDLYMDACKCFHHARLNLETLADPNEEMLNLLKVAKTNFIVMKLLHSGHKEGSKDPPEFDFSVHKNFPTLKVI